jgi:uncharacterized protein YndB with AHSA1/START domain
MPDNVSSRAKISERTATDTCELTFVRLLDSPRELVFSAWTDPHHLAQWWGPQGFTNPVCEVDMRPGGVIRIVMRAPDGVDYPMAGAFREIVWPERLVFTAVAQDKDGNPHLESLATVTFVSEGDKTKLTVHVRATSLTASGAQMLEGMEAGWTQTLGRLGDYVLKA